ncbi:ATP-binding protein [Micromonospora sp. RTGN7]|uniref:ATP-binding protein n=1 Tax=Micromonospora sp. RTGN7 TaxID=3016526 RepID=UPI0029FF1DA9|nr:ATP-binding protein [Micromonospora sp. RTGN7]
MSDLTAYLDMPLGVHAPTAARRAVTAVLRGWGFRDEEWLEVAAVVTRELVTNAVRYGGGCVEFRIEARQGRVVLSVADTSPALPRHRDPDVDEGRGITLIEASPTRWGVHNYDDGKQVWVELTPCPGVSVDQPRSTTGRHHEHHSTHRTGL